MGAPSSAPPEGGEDPLVEVGRFGRPHGVRGEVTFHSGGTHEALPYQRLLVAGRRLEVLRARPKGGCLLLTLQGIDSPELARTLTGLSACVRQSDLPPLSEGSHYLRDLVGMEVVDAVDGARAGVVREVQRLAGRDYLEIERGVLIPLADELVVSIDGATRTITMRLPEGLLDLDTAEEA